MEGQRRLAAHQAQQTHLENSFDMNEGRCCDAIEARSRGMFPWASQEQERLNLYNSFSKYSRPGRGTAYNRSEGNQMVKTTITPADLQAHLDEQLGFLERSAAAFDSGALPPHR